MIYYGIDKAKTIENVEEKLTVLKELFKIRAYVIEKPEFNEISQMKLETKYTINFSTPYDNEMLQLMKGITHLPERYKSIIFLHFIEDISLYQLKCGNYDRGIPFSNVYPDIKKGMLLLSYTVKDLIIYKKEGLL